MQEDLEDENGAVHDAKTHSLPLPRREGSIQCLFYIAYLARREFVIEDHQLNRCLLLLAACSMLIYDIVAYLLQLALAHIGRGVGVLQALHEAFDRLDMVGVGEERKFVQIFVGSLLGLLRRYNADQNSVCILHI